MKIVTMTLGDLETSSYIIASESGNAAVVDPADNAEYILSVLEKNGWSLNKILLTHGHFDHTGAAAELKEKTSATVYIHTDDVCMLDDTRKNVAYLVPYFQYRSFTADVMLNDGDSFEMDEITFTVMSTPGHTAGSILYFAKSNTTAEECIFAGDTIFENGVGRVDFYSGSGAQQRDSLKKLAALKKDYIIYPGHGGSTTLNQEKRFNPYLANAVAAQFMDSL